MTDLITENARLRAALELAADRLLRCAVEYDAGTLRFIETGEWANEARALLATPAPDAVQEAARVPEIAALIEAVAPYADPLCIGDYDTLMTAYRRLMIAIAGDRT